MFNISKNKIITVTRGDSFEFTVTINCGTDIEPIRYQLTENDTLYFALCEPHQSFEKALIKKVYVSNDANEDGDVTIYFKPQDTEHLLPGTYYYEVKVKSMISDTEEYDVTTVIPKTKFIIVE